MALDVLGARFLVGATDFADHDDAFGRRIRSNSASTSMKFMPRTGSPPMPTQVLCPSPLSRGLKHRLVGQRARARDDADAPLLVDEARHDADLAFAGGDDARAVRADEAASCSSLERALTRTMSLTGMPSVMHTISSMPASAASRMASAAKAAGT